MNLIAIAGRMGSGKDTTAKLIQNLIGNNAPHLREFEQILDPNNEWILGDCSGWRVQKFARSLKVIASQLTGIPYENFEDQEFKKTNLGPEWDNMPVRVFLQKLGTEAMRDGLHQNTWINAMYAGFKKNPLFYEPKWLVTDCRFQNEFDSVKARGGKVIYVERGTESTGTHPSEVEMAQFKDKCDYHIYNNGDLNELEYNIKLILKDLKLVEEPVLS